MPKSPLRGFSDAATVLLALVIVAAVVMVYVIIKFLQVWIWEWPRVADAVNFGVSATVMWLFWEE